MRRERRQPQTPDSLPGFPPIQPKPILSLLITLSTFSHPLQPRRPPHLTSHSLPRAPRPNCMQRPTSLAAVNIHKTSHVHVHHIIASRFSPAPFAIPSPPHPFSEPGLAWPGLGGPHPPPLHLRGGFLPHSGFLPMKGRCEALTLHSKAAFSVDPLQHIHQNSAAPGQPKPRLSHSSSVGLSLCLGSFLLTRQSVKSLHHSHTHTPTQIYEHLQVKSTRNAIAAPHRSILPCFSAHPSILPSFYFVAPRAADSRDPRVSPLQPIPTSSQLLPPQVPSFQIATGTPADSSTSPYLTFGS
ncbi:hypothetical protein LZ32DRAFT_310730 [Colletotrichum eremochloae]|nr:hypothetical protein LZ32DRAFT_310730 [Colletotrichum eremochloae]